jgi:transcriptional regulator with XRE-family HTH domain
MPVTLAEQPVSSMDAILQPPEGAQINELGAFLRSRRESLEPARLGFARAGRRRTPGLRREEVAQLAEVGITWYTWLEQGRSIRVSPKVLGAIATALQCSEAETRHLFTLAGLGEPPAIHRPSCDRVSPLTQTILDSLDPFLPALIQNARFDILAYNQAYRRLMGVDLAQVPEEDRNCIFLTFNSEAWRSALVDADMALSNMVASFRAAMVDHRGDPVWEAQLQRFMESDEFRRTWQRYEVRSIENQLKHFRHPRVGIMQLQQTNWWSAPRHGDRLLVYVPVDEASAGALRQLAARPLSSH